MESDFSTMESNHEDGSEKIETIPVFLDTGMQKWFIPLQKPQNAPDPRDTSLPKGYRDDCNKIEEIVPHLPEPTRELLKSLFSHDESNAVVELTPYIKARFGRKEWHCGNGVRLNGLWLTIETNTSSQDGTNQSQAYDRGIFYQTDGLREEEKAQLNEQYRQNPDIPLKLPGKNCYIQLRQTQEEDIVVKYRDPETGAEQVMDLGTFRLRLVIRRPNGEIRDTDVILDLGNTRTAALFFDHTADATATFEPLEFKNSFKVLRVRPDPHSGESDELDNLSAGIVSSWFVLHQLEHQRYKGSEDSKEPERLQLDYRDLSIVTETHGWLPLFRRRTQRITGSVRKLLPQMFMQLSPILIGDQASRIFNFPYAKELVKAGAQVQQSSPKRYYWDDMQRDVWWNMLLNPWDPAYSDEPANEAELPMLQGDMLRFIHEDGSLYDFTRELQPHEVPNAYPHEPKYPRQSTLTWFLLHLLERAYAQVNASTFAAGGLFIPHRLSRIAITYPAGWSADEVNRYRQRCQEALDIFSQANLYHGVHSKHHLELVPAWQAPDEAVASQLPFVFSEIIRIPGLEATDWIRLAGKERSGGSSVRIMNFDIGGGTSDISIVEYQCVQSDAGNNNLQTCLLFKDGYNLAGDDLVRDIIAKVILGGLVKAKGSLPCASSDETIGTMIHRRFSTPVLTNKEMALRSRITRSCLIPLALHCLTQLGQDSVQFSARKADINQNNWREFLEFIDAEEIAIPMDKDLFSFSSQEINEMMEKLFGPVFANSALTAAAYDVDMVIFSGKTSELPHIKDMARIFLPMDENRIIFAKEFKPGSWYPFTDSHDYIADAKTVTVVGSALYYALSRGFIAGWSIVSLRPTPEPGEWGILDLMQGMGKKIFMSRETNEATIKGIRPNAIIGRRLNRCFDPMPVYKLISHRPELATRTIALTLKREMSDGGETLVITAVDGSPDGIQDYELKIWPCEKPSGFTSWQEDGYFNL